MKTYIAPFAAVVISLIGPITLAQQSPPPPPPSVCKTVKQFPDKFKK